jgi:hypothetical protein
MTNRQYFTLLILSQLAVAFIAIAALAAPMVSAGPNIEPVQYDDTYDAAEGDYNV